MTLKELEIGQTARITSVGGEGALRQHFLDMGVIPGAEVTLIKYAPMGDPMELRIHGYELTLRLEDAEKIQISRDLIDKKQESPLGDMINKDYIENKNKEYATNKSKAHPGLGEGGKYHEKKTSILFQKVQLSHSLWQATRIAARLRCSTS